MLCLELNSTTSFDYSSFKDAQLCKTGLISMIQIHNRWRKTESRGCSQWTLRGTPSSCSRREWRIVNPILTTPPPPHRRLSWTDINPKVDLIWIAVWLRDVLSSELLPWLSFSSPDRILQRVTQHRDFSVLVPPRSISGADAGSWFVKCAA